MQADERLAILKGLPKVELHRHLEGSVRLPTLVELGKKYNLYDPLQDLSSLSKLVTFQENEPRTLENFLQKFRCDWYRTYRDIERVASEVISDAAQEGVVYLELRFSPEHLTRSNHLDIPGVIEAVGAAGNDMAKDCGIGARYIVTLVRERYDYQAWKQTIDWAVEMSELGIVGVDLAGDEIHHPNHIFERIFRRVKDTGVLGTTIHAGEGTNPEQVSTAIQLLGAKRIGHGLSAIEDPQTIQLLREREITLEICPVSNFQTGCIDNLEHHPLPKFDQAGVAVCINSDDPTIHRTTINSDYDIALTRWGYSLDDLLRLERFSIGAAFLPDYERGLLRETVEKNYAKSLDQGI